MDPTGCGGIYTVVLSDYDGFGITLPQSFEFSANFSIAPGCKVYLPLVHR